MFQSIVCVTYIYIYIYIIFFELFWSKKIKYFLLVLTSMFCEHYILPQVKNIGSVKRYFHTFPFQDCFYFHLMLLLKEFLVLSGLLKPAFEKNSKGKFFTNLEKQSDNQHIPHWGFYIKNNYEWQINYT